MSLLERLGLSPKTGMRRAGVKLDRSRTRPDAAPELERNDVLRRMALFGALVALAVIAFPIAPVELDVPEIGTVWQDPDVVAPFNFPIYISDDEWQSRRDSIRYDVAPVFNVHESALEQSLANLDSVRAELQRAFGAYGSWQLARSRGQLDAAATDSVRFFRLRERVGPAVNTRQWTALLDSYAARVPGLDSRTRTSGGPPLSEVLLQRSATLLAEALAQRGVLDVVKDSVRTPDLSVVNESDRTERVLRTRDVFGIDESVGFATDEFQKRYTGKADTVTLGASFFRYALVPSLRYDQAATAEQLAQQEANISRVRDLVREGEVVLRRGDVVTVDARAKLLSLRRARAAQSGTFSLGRFVMGQLILVIAAYTVFFLYLYLLRRSVFGNMRLLVLIGILFAAILGAFAIAARTETDLGLGVPVALVSILLTVLFDSRVGMFATVCLALLAGLIFGLDFELAFATLFAGTVAVFSVRDIKNRSQIFITAALVFGAYLAIIVGLSLMRSEPFALLTSQLIQITVNCLLLLFAYPLLWALERTFRVTTDLTLLELSDTNRPLLKELSIRASGTFNHVLQVANLAEAAADAVGANALLARVGAIYHDIGKMLKPEYFIENQQPGENPHDRLKPHMSALIIASHVKDGVELGREHNLPDKVLDFIPTHHGTTLMEYFFRKAQEQAENGQANAGDVEESEFRYPGPRPQTSEQGIVMLADSIEAASRSLQKPTPKRLEALIDGIIKARVEDGQLNKTQLTFSDLDRVKETFLSILSGVYHFRVKYPGQDKESGDSPDAPPGKEAAAKDAPAKDDPPPAPTPAPKVPSSPDDTPSAAKRPPDAQPIPDMPPSGEMTQPIPRPGYSGRRPSDTRIVQPLDPDKPGPTSEERSSLG